MLPTRIYLTGFMGCGKSTVGARLAQRLGYAFVDLDRLVEERAGRTVAEVFADEGEAGFRRIEAEALAATTTLEGVVIALGGGTLVREDNLRLALEAGRVVYLRVPVPFLVRRLLRSRTVRPLLLGPDGERLPDVALWQKVATTLAARELFYRQAHHTVENRTDHIADVVDAVEATLRKGKQP